MKPDLVEIFGHKPTDTSTETRKLWQFGACPFIRTSCIKHNHDETIIYGTCSVTSPYGDIIICPYRLYANDYETIKKVAVDAFGAGIQFFTYNEFIAADTSKMECIVALGANSGKEVKVGQSLSMDWILAHVKNNSLVAYTGIEVQSIDITGNYRDAWHGYKSFKSGDVIPSSQHGLNWANVHKRLIPQIIRKGVIYSKSEYCNKGLYFILPEIVYNKFEDVIGRDIPTLRSAGKGTLTVYTYKLDDLKDNTQIRGLVEVRKIHISLDEFSKRFIAGAQLPPSSQLDSAIKKILGIA